MDLILSLRIDIRKAVIRQVVVRERKKPSIATNSKTKFSSLTINNSTSKLSK